jgi:hypothetical protein
MTSEELADYSATPNILATSAVTLDPHPRDHNQSKATSLVFPITESTGFSRKSIRFPVGIVPGKWARLNLSYVRMTSVRV